MKLDSKHIALLDSPSIAFKPTPGFVEVSNPATNEALAFVRDYQEEELENLIQASQKAQKHWSSLLALDRANLLWKWYELMLENKQALAEILTLEMGKPIGEALGEIGYGANFIRWYAEECRRANGEVLQSVRPGERLVVLKQPIGVCGALTPWNFPSAMITRKAAPALAVGCSMIVKPATQTPLSAYALLHLALKAGIPQGVLEVVTGQAQMIGGVLCKSPIIRKLSFTGSTEVGRKLMAQSANTIKKLSLELGGNAPFIVFDDACLEDAIKGIMASKFRNSGQTCVCANRIYVQDGIYDALASALKIEVEKLKVGNGLDASTTQGPLIDSKAVAKVKEHVDDAVSGGACVISGGKALGGNFFEPTVIVGASMDMAVAREETFGPLAPLFRFHDEDEVVAKANDTEYGLAAYLYTKDASRQWRVSEALEYGMVGINTGIISTEAAPFGGVKQSGLGREGSSHGMDEYLEIKYLCLNA